MRNVTFRNISLWRPLKAIYIKSNPGDQGTGLVENIVYEDIFIQQALWWTVWIGPQQQNQPGDSSGTGCNFLFPYIPICPTQPLVTMRGIVLRNVIATDTLPLFQGPGVVLCDAANPCRGLVFDNVVNTPFTGNTTELLLDLPFTWPPQHDGKTDMSDDWSFEYITSEAFGTTERLVNPPVCLERDCWWQPPATVH